MKKKKEKLFFSLAMIFTIPLLVLGCVVVYEGRQNVSEGMEMEIQKALAATAHMTADLYGVVYPGEIAMEDDRFTMGGVDLTADYALADRIKETTGYDVSIFWNDTRVITTVVDDSGQRIAGSELDNLQISEAVFMGNEFYSASVKVGTEDYYGYYIPLYDGEEICGMVFAGETNESVVANVQTIVMKVLLVFVLSMIIVMAFVYSYARNLVSRLNGIRSYIGGLADNDFGGKMPKSVYRRNDEIAEMGEYSVEVAKTIKDLINNDPLTTLLNRRAGRKELAKYMEKADVNPQDAVTVALGDIDFFKKVNDEYGHECGDMVLVTISELMKKYLAEKGFCSRWGGEEFLLVYRGDFRAAKDNLTDMMEELRNITFSYGEYNFHVTMTFGITRYKNGESLNELVKKADDLLYRGKKEGRNRIVK